MVYTHARQGHCTGLASTFTLASLPKLPQQQGSSTDNKQQQTEKKATLLTLEGKPQNAVCSLSGIVDVCRGMHEIPWPAQSLCHLSVPLC